MSRLWPIAEAAQADYESLRAAALAGTALIGPTAARFEVAGLWALIRKPAAEPVFTAQLFGARRAAWTPYGDPRLDALGAAYQLVLVAADAIDERHEGTGS